MKTGKLADQSLTASLPLFSDANKNMVTKSVVDARAALAVGYPAFLAHLSTRALNVTGDSTLYSVVFDNEVYDLNSNYNPGTGVFTAPVTGKYSLKTTLNLEGLATTHTMHILNIVTSNRPFTALDAFTTNPCVAYRYMSLCVDADMDANDTAYVQLDIRYGSKDVDIYGTSTTNSFFSGHLIC